MLEVKKWANSLVSVQRTAALRISPAYRTAVLVTASTIPVYLLAAERTEIFKAKPAGSPISGHIRENTIKKWQRRRNDEDKGKWTARLIPCIRPWIDRKFGEVNYCYRVTEILGNICTE